MKAYCRTCEYDPSSSGTTCCESPHNLHFEDTEMSRGYRRDPTWIVNENNACSGYKPVLDLVERMKFMEQMKQPIDHKNALQLLQDDESGEDTEA